jgi:hypothetical protein
MHKKGLSDYVYYLGSARQASDYEKTTDYLINHVRKTFSFRNNIGMALENLEEYDMSLHHPTLQVSTLTDAHQGREFIANGALENGAFCTVFSENFHKF